MHGALHTFSMSLCAYYKNILDISQIELRITN